MALTKPRIVEQENLKKGYGQTGLGFTGGMITEPFAGVGLQLFINALIRDGEIHKMKGNREIAKVTTAPEILLTDSFQAGDGTFQKVVAFEESQGSGTFKFRAFDAQNNEIIPATGGGFAGDVEFDSDTFNYIQITLTGYLANKVAGVKRLHRWDGTGLTVIPNCPANPEALGREGRRLLVSGNGLASGSRSDQNPILDFTGGSNADISIDFRVNTPGRVTAFLSTGSGTMLWFETGAEMHNIHEIDDGTGVFNETRNQSFSYTGEGVSSPRQVTMGANFAYAQTDEGIIKVSAVNGDSVNIMDDSSGKIRDYWLTFDIGKGQIQYAPNEKAIVATLSKDDTQVNDLLVCYYEETNVMAVKENSTFRSLGVVNKQLIGGSSVDGSIRNIFDKTTFQNGDGFDTRIRIVSEWDTITNMTDVKLPLDFFTFGNAFPGSVITLNFYIDGDITDPICTFTFTIPDLSDNSSEIAELGEFLLAYGKEDDDTNSDKVTKNFVDLPFHSYCWEVIESSQNNFVLRDVILEYDTLNEIPEERAFPNQLFSI